MKFTYLNTRIKYACKKYKTTMGKQNIQLENENNTMGKAI